MSEENIQERKIKILCSQWEELCSLDPKSRKYKKISSALKKSFVFCTINELFNFFETFTQTLIKITPYKTGGMLRTVFMFEDGKFGFRDAPDKSTLDEIVKQTIIKALKSNNKCLYAFVVHSTYPVWDIMDECRRTNTEI